MSEQQIRELISPNSFGFKELSSLLSDYLGLDRLTPKIENQILKYHQQGITFKQMGRCAYYWVEVLGNKFEFKYGVAIIPYIVDSAGR